MPTGIGGEKLWLSPTVANNVNPFDDQSGNSNNGTNNGSTVVSDSASGGSYAYDFDGVNDWIECSGPTGNSGAFSLALWINRDGSVSQVTTIASQYDVTASDRYWFLQQKTFSTGNIFTTNPNPNTSAGKVETETTFIANSGTWYHLVALHDAVAGEQRLYIDGVLVDSDTSTGFQATTIGLSLGALDGIQFWSGKLDDVRQYDRAITQAEITHLATSRGVLGPPGGATHYNPFKTHAFTNNFQQRLR